HIECSSDSTYFVTIEFTHQHTSDSFDLHLRSGVFGSFAYSDLPLTLELPVEPFSHQLIKVVDGDDPHCFKAIEFVVDCGEPNDCKILELEAFHIECSSDSTYFVTIDFFHQHTGDSFDLHLRSGVFGSFSYQDLPLTLELSIEPFDYQLIKVFDQDHHDCFKAVELVVDCHSSGISDNELKGIEVYPNPVSNLINIQTTSTGSYDYLIYDSQGRLMQSGRVSTDHSIKIGNWPTGPYFLHLRDGNGSQVHIIIKN
nr:T9SS type A sorting domain-containing protein [Saprospiraceae bacterium]